MPTPKSLPGWRAQGGKSRNFVNEKTGEILSRRQYDKLRGISFEAKAKENKLKDELAQLARPAKGRKSVVKAAPEFQRSVVEARKESKQAIEQREAARKELAAKTRMVNRKAAKKVHVKKIRDQLLEAGRLGARIPFNTYAEYVDLWEQIQSMGKKIFAYGLGIEYIVDVERSEAGQVRDVTVFSMMVAKDKISKADFEEEMTEDIENRSYLKFAHYWMHIKFSNEFAQAKAKRAGIKRNFTRK